MSTKWLDRISFNKMINDVYVIEMVQYKIEAINLKNRLHIQS